MSEKLAWMEVGEKPAPIRADSDWCVSEPDESHASIGPGASRHWATESFWILLATLAQAAAPALSILILARLRGLSVAGEFALAQAFTTPMVQLISLQLRPLLLTHSQHEFALASAAALRSISSLVGILVAAALFCWSGPIAAILMCTRIIDGWAELFQSELQRTGQSPRMAISSILRCFTFLLALLLLDNVSSALLLFGLLSTAILILIEIPGGSFRFCWDAGPIREFAWHGILLGGVLCLQAMQANFPRLLLERSTDKQTLGLFASLGLIMQLGNLVAGAYGQALLPEFARVNPLRIMGRVGLVALVALLWIPIQDLAGAWITALLVNRSDSASVDLIHQYSLVQVFVWPAAVVGCALTAKRLYRQQIAITASVLLLSVIVGVAVIPSRGLEGATITQATAAAATLLLAFVFLSRSKPKLEVNS